MIEFKPEHLVSFVDDEHICHFICVNIRTPTVFYFVQASNKI